MASIKSFNICLFPFVERPNLSRYNATNKHSRWDTPLLLMPWEFCLYTRCNVLNFLINRVIDQNVKNWQSRSCKHGSRGTFVIFQKISFVENQKVRNTKIIFLTTVNSHNMLIKNSAFCMDISSFVPLFLRERGGEYATIF